MADVARAAGVGVATVDRVLNKRAPVKADTVRRVHEAAAGLGFHAARVLAARVDELRPARRLGFLLQRRDSEFYRNFAAALQSATRAGEQGQHAPLIEHMDDLTPASVADRILKLGQKCDAVAIVVADHPKVNAAVEGVAAAGKPVFTLLSEISSAACAGSFAIDHRKAGRTAAWAITRLVRRSGDVAVMVGNHRYLGHELCEISFRSFIREHAPELRLLETLTSFEDRRFAYEATLDVLRRQPDLVGIYAPGGGIEGIVEALRERDQGRRVVVVAMELLSETREALLDGTIDVIIETPLDLIARSVVAAMLTRLDNRDAPGRAVACSFRIYVPENL